MAKITLDLIQKLRAKTGVGMMDCKKALTESAGDMEKAVIILRQKGAKVAAKRAENETNNGVVHAYIHPGGTLGVLVEVTCETDFSANTDTMREFAHNICMQIAAANPLYISEDQVDQALIEKERENIREELKASGKPETVVEKIISNKVAKYYSTICLLKQQYIKDDKLTVQDYLSDLIAKINENIKINRFARFDLN